MKQQQTPWHLRSADCLEWIQQQNPNSYDLVFGSPPYAEKGRRYAGGGRDFLATEDWVKWMLDVTETGLAVCRGYVIWIANSCTREHKYLPACEGLIWEGHRRGLLAERPNIWHKNGAPGAKNWFRNDYEWCIAFKSSLKIPYFNWRAVAKPPKYKAGGRFRQRTAVGGKRRLGGEYPQTKLARPGDVFRQTVGGGHMGHPLAHETEAPFPLGVAERFVLTCCPPCGVVLDPFMGSATTGHACLLHNRFFVGVDHRDSQVELATRRLESVREEMENERTAD